MNKKLQIKQDTDAFIALSEERTYEGQRQRIDRYIEQLSNLLMELHAKYMEDVTKVCSSLKELKIVSEELSYRTKPITKEEY